MDVGAVLDCVTPSWAAITRVVRAQLFGMLGPVMVEPTEVGSTWISNLDNWHVCIGLEPAWHQGRAGLGDVNADLDLGARRVLLRAVDRHPQVLPPDAMELAARDTQKDACHQVVGALLHSLVK